MIRKIIHIDEEKCNGCGLCATACHENAIGMVNGKATLLREDYCDGLGDCLPACPAGAITFVEREAPAYDEAAVLRHKASKKSHWPIQIKLVSVTDPAFEDADLLIAADCTAFSYAGFHQEFAQGKVTLIGCPKLDMTDYSLKLTEILRLNKVRSVTVLRMEVPCCGGLQKAVAAAITNSKKALPLETVIISTTGKRLN